MALNVHFSLYPFAIYVTCISSSQDMGSISPILGIGWCCGLFWPKECGRSDIRGIPLSPGLTRICSFHFPLLETPLRPQSRCSKNSKPHGKATGRRTKAIWVTVPSKLPDESQNQVATVADYPIKPMPKSHGIEEPLSWAQAYRSVTAVRTVTASRH